MHIADAADASTNRKRDIDMMGDPVHQLPQRLSLFIGRRYIQKDQLIGSFPGIQSAQFNRITGIADLFKVYPFYGPSVSDIQAGDDTFG